MNVIAIIVANLPVSQEEALGLTWGALILWGGGALGGFARALNSQTQDTFSKRTLHDLLVGGFTGTVLPILAQYLPFLSLDLSKLTALDKAAIAFFVGLSGSLVFTSTGWKMGWIVPSSKGDKEPRKGVLADEERRDAR